MAVVTCRNDGPRSAGVQLVAPALVALRRAQCFHRQTGEVHALNLVGYRELIETGEIAGPGTYVYEPPGTVDSWRCVGDSPCVIRITLTGRIEYLDSAGNVSVHTDAETACLSYLEWCTRRGLPPNPALGVRADGTIAG
jgi:hypothetical protein